MFKSFYDTLEDLRLKVLHPPDEFVTKVMFIIETRNPITTLEFNEVHLNNEPLVLSN